MGIVLSEAIGVVMLTVLLGGAGAVQVPSAPQPGITKARTEKGLYQLKIVEPGYDVTVTETDRRPQSSVLEVKGVVPTVTANGTVLFRAIYDIAKERGFEHAFLLIPPAGSRPRPLPKQSDGWHLSDVMTVFMVKDPKTPLKELLGADYSAESQEVFDRQGYLSMAMFAVLYGGREANARGRSGADFRSGPSACGHTGYAVDFNHGRRDFCRRTAPEGAAQPDHAA